MSRFKQYIEIIEEMKVLPGLRETIEDQKKYKNIDLILNEIKNKLNDSYQYLIILVGIPASGKSTFIKKLRKIIKNIGVLERDQMVILNAKIINREIKKRKLSHEPLTYDKSFEKKDENKKQIDDNVNQLMNRKEELVQNKKIVIADRTNLTKVSRKQFIDKFPKRKIIAIDFYRALKDVDNDKKLNAFILNAKQREDKQKDIVKKKTLDQSVFSRMLKQYEIPSKNEGIDIIYNVSYQELKNIIKL
jgi:predicted kinase